SAASSYRQAKPMALVRQLAVLSLSSCLDYASAPVQSPCYLAGRLAGSAAYREARLGSGCWVGSLGAAVDLTPILGVASRRAEQDLASHSALVPGSVFDQTPNCSA